MTILLFHRVAAQLAQLVQARLSPFTFLVKLSFLALLARLLLSLNVSSSDLQTLLLSLSTTLQGFSLHLHPALVKGFLLLLANFIILALFFSSKGRSGITSGGSFQDFSYHLGGKDLDFSAEEPVLFNGPRPIPSAPPWSDLHIPSAPPITELYRSPAASASQLLSVETTAAPSVDLTCSTPLSRNESHSNELEKVPRVAQDTQKSRKASITASSLASPSDHVELLHTYSPGCLAEVPVAQGIEKSKNASIPISSPAYPSNNVELLHTYSPGRIAKAPTAQAIEKSKKASITTSSPASPDNHVELLHTYSPGCRASPRSDAQDTKLCEYAYGDLSDTSFSAPSSPLINHSRFVPSITGPPVANSAPSTPMHINHRKSAPTITVPPVPNSAPSTPMHNKHRRPTPTNAAPPPANSAPSSPMHNNHRRFVPTSITAPPVANSAPPSPMHINDGRFTPTTATPPNSAPSTPVHINYRTSTPTIALPPVANSAPSSPMHISHRRFMPTITVPPVANSAPSSPMHISHRRFTPTSAALPPANSSKKGLFRHKSDVQSSTRVTDTYSHIERTVSCTHYYEYTREESCSVQRLYTASMLNGLSKEEANKHFSDFTSRKWASIRK